MCGLEDGSVCVRMPYSTCLYCGSVDGVDSCLLCEMNEVLYRCSFIYTFTCSCIGRSGAPGEQPTQGEEPTQSQCELAVRRILALRAAWVAPAA